MFVERFVVIFISLILIFLLSRRFIKRYAPENIFLIVAEAFTFGIYVKSVIENIYIPVIVQICLLIFLILLPLLFAFLQYNNIILSRKILYYKMKWEYYLQDFDKTIKYINRLITLDGRRTEYYYLLGMCYKYKKDYINSRDSFALSIELDRRNYKSYYELGVLLDETNKKSTAIIMFNNALRLKPNFYEAAEALGICLTSQAKYEDAVKVYEIALEYHPNACEIYYNIAMIELEIGDYEKSEVAFIKAAKLKPKLYSAYYNIGKINYLKGDYEKAIEFFKLARSSTMYGAKAYYKLAMVYAAKKENEKAISSLEYAMEIEPDYIKEASRELVFENIRNEIEEYINSKQCQKESIKNRNDYSQIASEKMKKKNEIEMRINKDIEKEKNEENIQENGA